MATPQNNFEKLIAVFARQWQELEDAFGEILNEAHVDADDTAVVGAQLDGIGELVGLERQGLSDSDYRNRLEARRLVMKSDGLANQLIAIVDLFLGGGFAFTYNENDNYDAGFEIEITDTLPAGIGAQLAASIKQARGAAINGYVTYHQSTPIFAFDGAAGAKFDGGSGLRGSLG